MEIFDSLGMSEQHQKHQSCLSDFVQGYTSPWLPGEAGNVSFESPSAAELDTRSWIMGIGRERVRESEGKVERGR